MCVCMHRMVGSRKADSTELMPKARLQRAHSLLQDNVHVSITHLVSFTDDEGEWTVFADKKLFHKFIYTTNDSNIVMEGRGTVSAGHGALQLHAYLVHRIAYAGPLICSPQLRQTTWSAVIHVPQTAWG